MKESNFEEIVKGSFDFILLNQEKNYDACGIKRSGDAIVEELMAEYKRTSNPDESLKPLIERGRKFLDVVKNKEYEAKKMDFNTEEKGLLTILLIGKIRETAGESCFNNNTLRSLEEIFCQFTTV